LAKLVDAYTVFGSNPGANVDWSLETLKADLDRYQVDNALTTSLRGVYYDFQEGNDETFEVCAEDRRLLPVATIDPRRYIDCIRDVKRCAERGFVAFRFFPVEQGWPYRYQPFIAILDAIAETGKPVIAPADTNGKATELLQIVGERSLPVILSDVGYATLSEALHVMLANPSFHVETHMLDTPDGLDIVAREVGAERLIFGSAAPQRSFASAKGLVDTAEMSQELKDLVLGGNIRRLIGGAADAD